MIHSLPAAGKTGQLQLNLTSYRIESRAGESGSSRLAGQSWTGIRCGLVERRNSAWVWRGGHQKESLREPGQRGLLVDA